MHNLVLFGRLLRGLGLDVNPGRMIDCAGALGLIDIGNRTDFYHTLRALLIHAREDIGLFDQAFEAFWVKPQEGWLAELPRLAMIDKRKDVLIIPPGPEPDAEAPSDDPSSEDADRMIELTRTPSTIERLRNKDFGDMTAEEVAEVQRLIAGLRWRPSLRRTRRLRPGGVRDIDFRRTFRESLRREGEFLTIAKRRRRLKPRPVVVIADISGSMERYARLLLHFVYALTEGLEQRVESFVFATKLTRITRELDHRELNEALRRVSASVRDWSGGTKIGEAIRVFNQSWGRRVLNGGAVVIVISDGWDCGEPAVLAHEMDRLHHTCSRLYWLNPLLGQADYQPLNRGMQAALPHIDRFIPVHNLSSLEALGQELGARAIN
jgi:uncharacterized protein